MTRICIVLLVLFYQHLAQAQEVIFTHAGAIEQVFLEEHNDQNLLAMNDLNVDFGYVLYQSDITTGTEIEYLELENIRDYAAVYVDGFFQGVLTDSNRKIEIETTPGEHILQLYVENIGRITYGPEILNNSKGIFGSIALNDVEIENWKMIPLNIRGLNVEELNFNEGEMCKFPSFFMGSFTLDTMQNMYLDISGWGMGEVWINDTYLGSYWEEEMQQSIQIPVSYLKKGDNKVIVFELKNNHQNRMKLAEEPVFR